MAQSSWPFENIDTSETQFSQWARNIGEGVKTGALNELEVFADSTGMQVKVRSGQALVRGHYYQNTAELALALEAADLTNPRVDTVVVELDPSANSIVLDVITGTPDPSPTAEPVVQTDAGIYQIKLAEIAVGTGVTTIAAGNVTDTRGYIEDFSGTVPGSAITGEITTATMDGDRLFNQIDSATIPGANVTGLTLSHVTDVTATAAEVNTLDGLTASTAELNKLDGVTATTAEINKLDGLTPTTTELNFVDGVTSGIQGQLNTLDSNKANLSGADFTGRVTASDSTEARYSVRNIYITNSATPSGGTDGDLWIVWE